jgi:Uma2 family endonuclease
MAVAHPEPYTVEELYTLPEDGMRHELLDGSLHVSPPPGPRHGLVAARLRDLLATGLPPGAVAVWDVGLRCGPARLLIPDLLVVPAAGVLTGAAAAWVEARDALLVVEVESPSSLAMDRITKPGVYAECGIPAFLRVVPAGPDGAEVHAHTLSATGTYTLAGSATAGQTITLPAPFNVAFDPAALTH